MGISSIERTGGWCATGESGLGAMMRLVSGLGRGGVGIGLDEEEASNLGKG